jgi:hypothetical protein
LTSCSRLGRFPSENYSNKKLRRGEMAAKDIFNEMQKRMDTNPGKLAYRAHFDPEHDIAEKIVLKNVSTRT